MLARVARRSVASAASVPSRSNFTRSATAVWKGDLAKGSGDFKSGTGKIAGSYSVPARFSDAPGTNPEELIAAAHSSCFSMALSATIAAAGFEPQEVKTTADVHIVKADGGWFIDQITLKTVGKVPKLDKAKFLQFAEEAKKGCPISKALTGPKILLEAKLEN